MQNENQQPINVFLPEGQNQLVLRQGQAPKQLDSLAPVSTDIVGTITAPLEWIKQRIADIDQHKAHLLVNRDDLQIMLVICEDDAYLRGSIKGKLQFSKIYKALGINSNKEWEPEQLGQFLKLNRTYFVSREQNMNVVNALKSFTAKVNQDVQRETKENGNRNFTFRQAVDSNIPESFTLRIPVFSGGSVVEIDVETYASVDGSHVTIALQSAGANDAVEDARLNAIGNVVDSIREMAPELVIIEQ
jgi:hypothetical protein